MNKEPWKFRISECSPWFVKRLVTLYPELYECADDEEKWKMYEKLLEYDKTSKEA